MATLNVIRRWALRENMSIREISRRTGMARNTVKKYLRSDETEPTYAKRVSSSKLDPFAEKLAIWLGMEATKSRKQRRNLKQIYTTVLQKLNPRRRRSRTYPQREHLVHTNRVGQDLMERLGQGSAQFNMLLLQIPCVLTKFSLYTKVNNFLKFFRGSQVRREQTLNDVRLFGRIGSTNRRWDTAAVINTARNAAYGEVFCDCFHVVLYH